MTESQYDARNLLEKVLTTQPELLSYANIATSGRHGEQAAEFCIKFIETYAAWLEKQDK